MNTKTKTSAQADQLARRIFTKLERAKQRHIEKYFPGYEDGWRDFAYGYDKAISAFSELIPLLAKAVTKSLE